MTLNYETISHEAALIGVCAMNPETARSLASEIVERYATTSRFRVLDARPESSRS